MEARSLGECLQAGRMERRMSLDDVAAVTKINPYYLKALEQNEMHLLPPKVYVRGYIRSVAQLLGLEANALYSLVPDSPELASVN